MKIGILQVGERVTEERVHEAVAYIVSEGQKPTFDNVKAYLGKGSKTTILPFIKSYTHTTGNAFEAMSETLPPDMLEDALTQGEKDKVLAFIEELFTGRDMMLSF